jgi:hypothetical protein
MITIIRTLAYIVHLTAIAILIVGLAMIAGHIS